MDKVIIDKLLQKAKQASERAYCPCSEVPVGACVLTQSGMLFTGCNIEMTEFSGSLGAMTVAIAKAVSEGENNILAIANYCEEKINYPSGSERQFLREFITRAQIICATKDKIEEFTVQELLPFSIK